MPNRKNRRVGPIQIGWYPICNLLWLITIESVLAEKDGFPFRFAPFIDHEAFNTVSWDILQPRYSCTLVVHSKHLSARTHASPFAKDIMQINVFAQQMRELTCSTRTIFKWSSYTVSSASISEATDASEGIWESFESDQSSLSCSSVRSSEQVLRQFDFSTVRWTAAFWDNKASGNIKVLTVHLQAHDAIRAFPFSVAWCQRISGHRTAAVHSAIRLYRHHAAPTPTCTRSTDLGSHIAIDHDAASTFRKRETEGSTWIRTQNSGALDASSRTA